MQIDQMTRVIQTEVAKAVRHPDAPLGLTFVLSSPLQIAGKRGGQLTPFVWSGDEHYYVGYSVENDGERGSYTVVYMEHPLDVKASDIGRTQRYAEDLTKAAAEWEHVHDTSACKQPPIG